MHRSAHSSRQFLGGRGPCSFLPPPQTCLLVPLQSPFSGGHTQLVWVSCVELGQTVTLRWEHRASKECEFSTGQHVEGHCQAASGPCRADRENWGVCTPLLRQGKWPPSLKIVRSFQSFRNESRLFTVQTISCQKAVSLQSWVQWSVVFSISDSR